MRSRERLILLFSCLFLFFFLIYPLKGIFERALFSEGRFAPGLFMAVAVSPTLLLATANSMALGLAVVLLSFLFALPFALAGTVYNLPFRRFLSGAALAPLVLPPFVGALGIERLFSRYGPVNAFLGTTPFDWLPETGFFGVALLQALHLYPVMLINLSAALSNVDPALKEAARVAGARPFRLFRDITLPLALPGVAAGGVVVFLWSLTDIGTPLFLGFRNVLAVEIFDRTASVGSDPTGPAMVVFVCLLTLLLVLVSRRFLKGDNIASRGARVSALKTPSFLTGLFIIIASFFILALSLLPHAGLLLSAFADGWFMTPLPDSYTLRFFGEALSDTQVAVAVRNSLTFASASALIDIGLGLSLAWILARRKVRAAWLLDAVVMLPLALPGLVLAFGYVATYSGTLLDPMKNPVPLLILGYSVRRLPLVFRAAFASLQQVGPQYEEAARVAGAAPFRAVRSVTLPLIGASVAGGALLAFLFSVLEVSESLILAVRQEFYPLARAIYNLFAGKIPEGEQAAAALGALCMIFLCAGLFAASLLMGKHLGKMFRM